MYLSSQPCRKYKQEDQSRPTWTKKQDPPQKITGVKGLEVWLKCYSACLASIRTCVQTLVPQKKGRR
jgi:hypothetical protein